MTLSMVSLLAGQVLGTVSISSCVSFFVTCRLSVANMLFKLLS